MTSSVLLLLLLSAALCPTRSELAFRDREKVQATAAFVSSTLQPKLKAMQDSKQQYEENIGKLLTRLGKATPDTSRRAGQALSVFLKSIGMLSKAAAVFATAAPYLNLILAFVPQDLPDVTLMKKQFVEVNRKLDSISLKVSQLLTEVQWSCYASAYSEDETEIENAWEKFTEFANTDFTQEDDKVKMAQAFIEFYENTATEGSVASFYRYLTQEGPSLRVNLFTILVEKFRGNMTAVIEYGQHFSAVMLRGLQLQLYYHIMKGYNKGEAKANQFAQKYNQVLKAQQNALLYCIQNYQKWIKDDVQEIGEKSAWQDSKDLAVNIKEFLDEKYFWLDWVVMVYGNDEEGHSSAGRYIEVPTRDRIVVLFNKEKGAQVSAAVKDKVQQYLSIKETIRTVSYPGVLVHKEITRLCGLSDPMDALKKDLLPHPFAAAAHAGPPTGKFHLMEYLGAVSVTCSSGYIVQYPTDYTVFLEGEGQSPPPCSSNPCVNGECVVIKETSGEFCKCHKNFYGDKCELNVLDELDWEQHQKKIESILSQPVPDLTSTMLKLTALLEHNKKLQEC